MLEEGLPGGNHSYQASLGWDSDNFDRVTSTLGSGDNRRHERGAAADARSDLSGGAYTASVRSGRSGSGGGRGGVVKQRTPRSPNPTVNYSGQDSSLGNNNQQQQQQQQNRMGYGTL